MSLRLLSIAIVTLAGALAGQESAAMGFGRVQSSPVLGQPLDFVVALRLDEGESLTAECVSARVETGESLVPASAVGIALEPLAGGLALRLRTSVRIDEPVVSVSVTAGCTAKVTRSFMLFADPPTSTAALPITIDADKVALAPASIAPDTGGRAAAAVPTSSALAQGPSTLPAGAGAGAAPASSTIATPAAPVAARRAASVEPSPEATKPTTRPAAAAKPKNAAAPRAPKRQASDTPALAKPRQEAPAGKAQAVASGRLRLDAPAVRPSSAAAAAAAASAAEREVALRNAELAAIAAQTAASEAAGRVVSLEKGMEALRVESRSTREAMDRLNRALAESEERNRWLPVLLAAALILAALAGWLLYKLRRAGSDQEAAWWASRQQESLTAPSSPGMEPLAAPETPLSEGAKLFAASPAAAPTVGAASSSSADLEAAAGPELPSQRTAPMPGSMSPRDMSIEELLDLEQQAEFFLVLGQDDAAIDLLVDHLRGTGGTVPLPYLKLMEIYRRLGDRAAYDRTRDRFNHRFNAVAPAWDIDQMAGRSLEDYPAVIARVEADWPRSVDAMATLETMLFRAEGFDVFDLPAYRDVMFLYMLAHDLLAHSSGKALPRIDVMLPLGTAEAGVGGVRSSAAAGASAADDSPFSLVVEDAVTVPVDLDLSLPDLGPNSQFGVVIDDTAPFGPR